jgi:signal peptidase I
VTTTEGGAPGRKRAFGCLIEIVETVVLTLIIFWVIQSWVAQPFRVQQESMQQTLQENQYVLVDKLTPRFDPYKRGDIVVFEPPNEWDVGLERHPFIKRVIGIGGDAVEIRDGSVYVNDIRLVEDSYVFEEADGQTQPTDAIGPESRWLVPAGELFLMGDHRANSADSREFGSVAVDKMVGRAWLRYWPIDTFTILPTPTHLELATRAP